MKNKKNHSQETASDKDNEGALPVFIHTGRVTGHDAGKLIQP